METGKKPMLSISMLVSSGRTETIRRCMESLLPLRQAIPSELILVDTGCTDESIEIARGYADQVVSFVWCNDFSAARNAGLVHCTGEWFLYLDDDEWFEDVTELIDFFRSGEYKRYEAGWYLQRNYDNFEGTKYVDSYAGRMCRLTPQTRFSGKIHECLTPLPTVIKRFGTYVHHYGYVYRSEEERQKHLLRNLKLEEAAVAEHPEDIRMCCQLIQEYRAAERFTEAEMLCRRTLATTTYGAANSFVQYLKVSVAKILAEQKRYEEALTELGRLEQETSLQVPARIAVLLEKARLCAQKEQESEALAAILELFKAYDHREEEKGYPIMDFAYYTSEEMLRKALHLGLFAMIHSERYELSEELLDRVDWSCTREQTENYLKAIFQILSKTGRDELFLRETRAYFEKNPAGEDFLKLAEYYWEDAPSCRETIAAAAADYRGDRQGFWELLALARKHYAGESLAGEAESFFAAEESRQDPAREELFLENSGALPVLIAQRDLEDFTQIVAESIQGKATEALTRTYNAMLATEELYPAEKKPYYHRACGLTAERILLQLSENETGEVTNQAENADISGMELLKSALEEYVFHQQEYCRLVYRPEILEDNPAVLPKNAQFALLMLAAYQREEDFKQWGALVKQAARVYPVMLPVVRRLLEEKADKLQTAQKANLELEALGEQLQVMIRKQLAEGKLTEARALLTEVETMLPNAAWVKELREKL